MPGFNKKGPEGKGPMTGRAKGECGNKKGLFRNDSDDTSNEEMNRPLRLKRKNKEFGKSIGRGRFSGNGN